MRHRVRISTLALVVALCAFDFAWLARLNLQPRSSSPAPALGPLCFDLGLLPMVNVLAIVTHLLRGRRQTPDPFLVGFAYFGVLALFIYLYLAIQHTELLLLMIAPLFSSISPRQPIGSNDPILLAIGAISWTIPELLIAMIGGWLARSLARRGMADRD